LPVSPDELLEKRVQSRLEPYPLSLNLRRLLFPPFPMKTMQITRFLLVSIILSCCVLPRAPGNPSSLPVSAFFGLPNVAQPRLSPDGSKIAFLFPHEGRMALGLFDRKSNEAKLVIQGRDESLLGFFWKGNDRLVFYADVGGNESFFIASTDLSGRRVLRIAESQMREDSVAGATVVLQDELRADPDRIVVRGFFAPSETANLLALSGDVVVAKLNIRNKARSPLYTLNRNTSYYGFVTDQAGTLRLRGSVRNGELQWEHRGNDGQSWRPLARHPFHGYAEAWTPVRFTADNAMLYVVSRERQDRGALLLVDPFTGESGPPLFVPPAGEMQELVFSADDRTLLGVAYETDRRQYHWFDADRAALQQKLEATFPGLEVRVTSSSRDGSVHLVWVGSDREPGAYLVLDNKAGSLATFRRVRDLDPALMRPTLPIRFAARDGLEIHGYLTLPAGADRSRPGPLIILPHGGPFGVRDSWEFNPEVQFLASRGYGVLQVNYRGSGGYGKEFLERGRRQWGRGMQDDLTDAVRWAIGEGHADPARVGIMGASYGGYAALAGVTLTPELYACAVNYVGAADLEITFKDRGADADPRSADVNYRDEWVGATKEYRDATSPVNLVANIRVPTFHAYGAKDPRVKIDHWTRLEAELKRLGKPYEAIEERQQGHGFRNEKASIAFYTAVEDFLARNLAPVREGSVRIGPTEVLQMPARP